MQEKGKPSKCCWFCIVKRHTERLPYTIFIADPSEKGLSSLRQLLQTRGFRVRPFKTARSLLQAALASVPSMLILETDLPDQEGLEVCRRIRQTTALSLLPIVFVSSRVQEADLVAGLEAGADDYITKPFATRELISRVRAHLRRCYELNEAKTMRFGHFEIDPEAVILKVNGTPVGMPLTEFRLLEYLVRNPGRTFSRMHLLKMIHWGARVVKPRVVDVYVKRIRGKIELDKQHPEYLRTVRRLGYCFQLPAATTRKNLRETRLQ
jgi:DNA-binding response OmpR family regulator